jgi:hypothetical protein
MKQKIKNTGKMSLLGMMLLFLFMSMEVFAQSNSIVFQGDGSTKGYLVLNNGSETTPIYLVVNNTNDDAITRTGTEAGWILSENEFNIVRWNMGTSTGTYVVPFGATTGDEADEYIPLTFAKTSSGSANVMFATYGTGADNSNYPTDVTGMDGIFGGSAVDNMVDRFYFIDVTAAATAEISFSYRGAENGTTTDPTNLTSPQQWDNTSETWLSAVGPGASGLTTSIGSIPTGSVSSFSSSKVWALSHNENPLPIQLINFDAQCIGKQVNVTWSTLTETNNALFTLQRSLDANNFMDIANLPGAGNSNTQLNYSAIDHSPLHNLAYYRLKQTDFDGNYAYSEVVAVESCNTGAPSCETYFDPAQGAVIVNFQGEETLPFTVSMFDMMGQQLIPETSKQLGRTDLDVGFLAFGVYLVVVRTEKDIFSTKVYLNR